jgi:uncharacterized protein YndB with AHSA1/START domain
LEKDMEIVRKVTTRAPLEAAFRYLSDFTTTTEWDPGTVSTTLLRGDGGVGTAYRNVSRFAGRQTELTYVLEQLVPGSLIQLRGENRSVTALDTMTFEAAPGGPTQVTYRAAFSFKGFLRLVAPLLAPAFRRLGDEAERGLRDALDKLAP